MRLLDINHIQVLKHLYQIKMKDKIVFLLSIGIIILLGMLIIGDFIISLKENRPVDESIIHLIQISITGIIGILGTYFGMKNKNK